MPDLMTQGVTLAVYGMGMVFLFLGLLVLATMLMSSLVPAEPPDPAPASENDIDPGVLMAIREAIQRYRRDH